MPNPEVKAPEAQEEEGAATSMAEARPEEEEGVEANMAGPKAAEDAESSAKAEEEEEDKVFVVVGTGEGVKASTWSPCKGRLLLIQLAKSGSAQKGTPGSNKISGNICQSRTVECMTATCSFIESYVHV